MTRAQNMARIRRARLKLTILSLKRREWGRGVQA